MKWKVYVTTDSEPDRSQLGPEWHEAGELDQAREQELGKVLQGQLGLRAPSREPAVEFYADLQTDSPGYQVLLEANPKQDDAQKLEGSRTRFWLALQSSGPPDKTFFGVQRAEIANLRRRPPEPHPGLLTPGSPIGVRLEASNRTFFTSS